MMPKKCEVCGGTGVVTVLQNYAGYHYEGDKPVYEAQGCEYCEYGIVPDDDGEGIVFGFEGKPE